MNELMKQAENLGVPTNSGIYKPKADAWAQIPIEDYELYRRIKEEKRHRREHRIV